jgi:PiT family inorganic phosphate transporter
MLSILLFLAVGFVAFTNGANANFKGVASLYGSGTTSLRTALYWGTATTFAGSIAAIFLGAQLNKLFTGLGIVPDGQSISPTFMCAVALGAALTSFLATRLGFPVSTTHALVGALTGAGLVAFGTGVRFDGLVAKFLLPLFVSPLLAAVLGGVIYLILKPLGLAPDHRTRTLDTLHFLSGGAASFARGLNDTPKMAALLTVAPWLDTTWGYVIVAVLIAAGGLLDADKVAETLGKKVTAMNPGQGFCANLTTALLVITGTTRGLPLSTTHVSVGSLLGIGIATRQAHWKKVLEIMLAWITTVPCGALFAAIAYAILTRIF